MPPQSGQPKANPIASGAAEFNQLVVLFNAGQHVELERRACSLLDRYPDSGFAWKVLGAALQMQGKDSLFALRKATEFLPGDPEAHYNLGNALLVLNRLDEAEACYRQALKIRPDDADTCFNLGNALRGLRRLDEAVTSYRHALEIKPSYAEAYSNLGNTLMESGRPHEAEASYRRALQIKPQHAAAHFNLGNLLHEQGRLHEAEASYRLALQARPDFTETCINLGNTLQDMGKIDEAEASYRSALQISPDHAEAHGNLGEILMESGRFDEAEASLRRALQVKPDCIKVRTNLALVKKTKADDENMTALIAVDEAARNGAKTLLGEDAAYLHFALGKCYDDIGDHEKAFSHFLEGNRIKRATFDYDPYLAARLFDSIMRNFDAAAIDRLRGGGDLSQLPIFVLGMPRSGTTLIEQIIASHPEVHGAGELPDLMGIAKRNVEGAVFPDNLRLIDHARLAGWGAEYVAGLQRRAPDALRITDKMPENFLAIGMIHLMLPNAKIIHVNRNPADTCLSCFFQLFRDRQEFTYGLSDLGRYYVGYARLMEHWRKVLPEGAFLDVRYEDMVSDQEAQSRRIIEYCGLEWDDACLDFHRNTRAVNTASMTQVRQPMYKSSVERWRPYEKHLKPLFDALGELAPDR
ncbi:MAG: tetratricopeptide repeat protein [Gallionella sp.]